MAQTLSVHQATVKFPAGKTFQTQYGDRVNAVLVISSTGEEVKLWGSPGDPALTALKKGQQVAVVQDQKGWKLLNTPPAEDSQHQPAAPSSQITHTPLEAEEKRAVAAYIDQLGDLYGYCQRVAVSKNLAQTDEDVRAIASTLFIQAVRHFNL